MLAKANKNLHFRRKGIRTKTIDSRPWFDSIAPSRAEKQKKLRSLDISINMPPLPGFRKEPSKPVIRRFFKKIDTTESVSHLAEALDRILSSDPDIRELRWRNEGE